jgi:hypothetical protein
MRLPLLTLVIFFGPALPLLGNTLGLQSVLAPDCSSITFQSFCTFHDSLDSSAGAMAGSNYIPGGRITDQILVGTPARTLDAEASSFGSTTYGGIHANLTANADYDTLSQTDLAADSSYVGVIQDYLVTTTKFANESWRFSFSLTASGTTESNSLDKGNDFSSTAFISIGVPGSVDCPSGSGGVLYGPISITCTATVPVQAGSVLPITFIAEAFAGSNEGLVTLDMNDTAKIDYVSIVDSSGTPDLTAQIYSRSGFDYNASPSGVSVPEPNTIFLFMGSGLALVLRKLPERALRAKPLRS